MRALLVDNVLLEKTTTGFKVELQPHLGLISLIATLAEHGHDAQLYDPKVQLATGDLRLGKHFYRLAAEQIVARSPDVVGFTTLGCNFICTLKIASAVRRIRPDIPILLGGPHASIVDREILERHAEFDIIVRGEAEPTIGAVFDALGGYGDLAAIDGLTYRRNGHVTRNRDVGPITDLDGLPMPAYQAFPIAALKLQSLDVDAGRGCPFQCSFCSTASFFGRRYRVKSAQRLVAELDMLAERYGIRDFNLTHDLFTVSKHKVREFCAQVAPRGYSWNCSARMDCVDDALLGEMREAGCNAIYYGVETGSQRMQRVVDKRLDLQLYHPTVRSSLALGLDTTVSFIIGFPAEEREDRDATLDLIGESLATYARGLNVQLHLLAPEPGTALYAQHARSLSFDGHVGDFNFPLLEANDTEIVVSEPDIFACHHYYADGGHRTEDVALTAAFRSLYRLGNVLLSLLANAYGESFGTMLRDFAKVRVRLDSDEAAMLAFVLKRWGEASVYYDIVRYVIAAKELAEDPERPRSATPPMGPIRLTRRAVAIDDCRDVVDLLQRLRSGQRVDSDASQRSPQLLISAPNHVSTPTMFAIDRITFDVATALRTSTTRDRLAAMFDARELDRRLWALEFMGAIVPGDVGVLHEVAERTTQSRTILNQIVHDNSPIPT